MIITISSATFQCRLCILSFSCDTRALFSIPDIHSIAHLNVSESQGGLLFCRIPMAVVAD